MKIVRTWDGQIVHEDVWSNIISDNPRVFQRQAPPPFVYFSGRRAETWIDIISSSRWLKEPLFPCQLWAKKEDGYVTFRLFQLWMWDIMGELLCIKTFIPTVDELVFSLFRFYSVVQPNRQQRRI